MRRMFGRSELSRTGKEITHTEPTMADALARLTKGKVITNDTRTIEEVDADFAKFIRNYK